MGKHSGEEGEASVGTTDDATDTRGWFRRHSLLTALLSIVTVLALAVGVFAYMLNHSLSNIERVPVTLNESVRPSPDNNEALNILLLGADAGSARNPGTNSILEDAASGKWPTGKYRSDATMLVHISADRKSTYVASIPRDSYVPVYDDTGRKRQSTKINAALSLYGPSGAISTVENLTGLRIDHLAMVDWDGFEDITNALGGVKITTASEGTRKLNGKEALDYVRVRKTLPGGDFGRVKRQQNFLRSILIATIDKGTLTNPLKLRSTVNAITKNMAVDEGWSNSGIRGLVFSMRSTRPENITFMTIPTNGTGSDPVAGSIVNVDYELSDQLFAAMRDDSVADFVSSNPDLLLGAPESVD
jgi:LCP family protein required for cell wall assembly